MESNVKGRGVARRGRLGLGLAAFRVDYQPDISIREGNEPKGGRKVKGGRISKLQIWQIKEDSGSSGLN